MWAWLHSTYVLSLLLFLLGILFSQLSKLLWHRLGLWLFSLEKHKFLCALRDRGKFPFSMSLFLAFTYLALDTLNPPGALLQLCYSLMVSGGVFLWMFAFLACVKPFTDSLKDWEYQHPFKEKSLPLIELLAKVFIILGATYGLLITWGVNVGAVLASAGLLGVVLGFAAKDSLSNLFSGFFIMADSPYHLGDYIQLDSGERGYITEIGMRSTRMMTRDDIEVIIPNSILASSKIINESGGHHIKERVRIDVGVSYESDVDKVKQVLVALTEGVKGLCQEPKARVRFRQLGDFSLKMQLLIWIEAPALRGRVVDEVNTRIIKRFREENIGIPFPQSEVRLVGGISDERLERDGQNL